MTKDTKVQMQTNFSINYPAWETIDDPILLKINELIDAVNELRTKK